MTGRALLIEPDLHRRLRLSAQLQAGYFSADVHAGFDTPRIFSAARAADLILLPTSPEARCLLALLRENGNSLTTPIVVLSERTLGSEERAEWFLAGADAVLDGRAASDLLLDKLASLTRFKQGNDRLMEAYYGFCEGSGAPGSHYPMQRAKALPVLDFDPGGHVPQDTTGLDGATPVHLEEDLISRLKAMPDAMVRLVMQHRASAEAGLRLIPQIRADAARRSLPILAHVGPGQEMVAQTALQIGASDIVIGDASKAELRARLIAADRRRYWAAQFHSSVLDQLRLSMLDPLTGLKNRRYADRYGADQLARCRTRGQDCAVVLLDIDRFKRINDTYGHPCGDRVLAVAARRIARAVRANDLVCRFGGEEFLLVLPETGSEEAHCIAQRVREAIGGRPIRTGANPASVSITISAGLAMASSSVQTTFEGLVAQADAALYCSKTEGRDRISLSQSGNAA